MLNRVFEKIGIAFVMLTYILSCINKFFMKFFPASVLIVFLIIGIGMEGGIKNSHEIDYSSLFNILVLYLVLTLIYIIDFILIKRKGENIK